MTDKSIAHKAKLETALGTFEFTGSQEYVEQQVAAITNLLNKIPAELPKKEESANRKTTKHVSKPSSALSDSPTLLEDLFGDKLREAREFVKSKAPVGHMENFLVIAYWLRENMQVKEVNIDHMYTGYKLLNLKPPKAINQVLRDAKSRKSFFNKGSDKGFYSVSYAGESFVEHDLPHKEDSG